VDPGITGAWAILDGDGSLIEMDDLPIIRDGRLAWIDAARFTSHLMQVCAGKEVHAMVERVHAMPRNGGQAAFSQGATLGSILAALQVLRARIGAIRGRALIERDCCTHRPNSTAGKITTAPKVY
jgi:hypothetical protein